MHLAVNEVNYQMGELNALKTHGECTVKDD